MDLYSTTVLAGVSRGLRRPNNFLLSLFFQQLIQSPTEDIKWDIEEDDLRPAPFCSPVVEGKVVEERGYQTKTFTPAYVKDKRRLAPAAALKRQIGEQIGGDDNQSPEARNRRRIAETMQKQVQGLNIRFELMASDVLQDGKLLVDGEGFDAIEVDFGRDAGNTVVLTGADRWGQTDIDPMDDLEEWSDTVLANSGVQVTDIVFGKDAWKQFRKSPQFKELVNMDNRGTASHAELTAFAAEGAVLKGVLGSNEVRLWVYVQKYRGTDGQLHDVMPADGVFMGSNSPEAQGIRYFGAILDEEAGLQAMEYFTKSRLIFDPSGREMLTQSAPLIGTPRANAFLAATVL
ncbi:major capsid protein [Maricaulis maris]|uniref:major capsid protein n=1 Tax=Maricaulis maris TaxID=74318 RepID=UPI003B8ADFCE